MNNIRLKQAQELVVKAANRGDETIKLNVPYSGHIDVKKFEKIFRDVISAEEFIYKSVPNHNLSKKEAIEFTKFLILARDNIDAILSDFKVIEKREEKVDIDGLTDNVLFITSKNIFKKSLKNLGIDVQRIIVASVPLDVEDMKEINPEISNVSLRGIKKKVEHIHNDIKKKKQIFNPEKIIVLAEKNLNGRLLVKRAEEDYGAIFHLSDNLKDLTESDLIEILENS
jgi:hypothetical protein